MKKVTDILDTLLMVAFMKRDAKSVELFQTAIDEVNATEAKIIELNNSISSLLLDDRVKEKKIRAFENADVTDNVIFVWDRTSSFIEEIQLGGERIALDIKKHYKVYIVEEA